MTKPERPEDTIKRLCAAYMKACPNGGPRGQFQASYDVMRREGGR